MNRYLITALFIFTLTSCEQASKPTQSVEVAAVGLHSAAISEDGDYVAVGSIYHGASLWRISDFERLFNWNHQSEEQSTIIAADFSDDNRWALTAEPHTMVLWNLGTGRGERYWTAPAEVLDVELNKSATLALLGLEDHSAVIFDIRRGGIRRTFTHQNRVRAVDFSEDARFALTGSEDYTAAVWDTESGDKISEIKHQDDVQFVKLSDDGRLALSVSKYDKAIIWDTRSGELKGEIPLKAEYLRRGLTFTSARFSKDNNYLLTGRPDQIVQLWKLDPALEELQRWKLPKRDAWKPSSTSVLDVAFSGTEKEYIAVGSAGFVHLLTRSSDINN